MAAVLFSVAHFTFMPGCAPESGDSRNDAAAVALAASTMPSEVPKRILRGVEVRNHHGQAAHELLRRVRRTGCRRKRCAFSPPRSSVSLQTACRRRRPARRRSMRATRRSILVNSSMEHGRLAGGCRGRARPRTAALSAAEAEQGVQLLGIHACHEVLGTVVIRCPAGRAVRCRPGEGSVIRGRGTPAHGVVSPAAPEPAAR